jgi:hypothetical protein
MKKASAILLTLLSLFSAHCAEDRGTNLVVTAQEVDPKSVRLTSAASSNLVFKYVSKTHEEIRAIAKRHSPVQVVKDGLVIAKAPSCTGYQEIAGVEKGVGS